MNLRYYWFFAALFASLGRLLKQPIIVTFIGVGIQIGSQALDLIQSEENITHKKKKTWKILRPAFPGTNDYKDTYFVFLGVC